MDIVQLPISKVKPNTGQIEGLDSNPRQWTTGGSGTTIIAAEQLGRKACLVELDPHYCDVIIARWEKMTGQKAVRLS